MQAVPKYGSPIITDPQNLIAYLDGLMSATTNTRIWNFSLNIKNDCPLNGVNSLSHDIAMLARKHKILPIISVGNKPGAHLQPPADCEAAITVGGRQHDNDGNPAGPGGYNLIVCAMDTAAPPCPISFPFTLHEGQLSAIYQSWEMLKYNEDLGTMHNGAQLQFATMLARKPV